MKALFSSINHRINTDLKITENQYLLHAGYTVPLLAHQNSEQTPTVSK